MASQDHSELESELHQEVGVAHGETGGSFPPFNPEYFAPQLVWFAILFGALYLLMSRVALPRIATVLEERRDRIADDIDKAQELKERTTAAIESYEKALAEARAKAHAIAAETHAEITAEIEAARAENEEILEARLRDADKRIAAMKDAALAHVREVAHETAGALVKKLLGSPADAASLDRAIDAQLGRSKAAE